MQIDFRDKRVLVTGGARGIGRGTVKAFLEAGARVAVNGRTAESTAAGIAALGDSARVLAVPGDIGTATGCEAVVSVAIETLGGLDVLVNSAGVGKVGLIEDIDEAFWDEMLDVNLKGTFFCIRWALAALRKSNGNIVNLASDAGLMGDVSSGAVYCASKGGIVNMTRAMALELAPIVRVNCVCPGFVDTDMVRLNPDGTRASKKELEEMEAYAPMGRIATPGEIATAILYLASDHALFVTGAAFQIDGGSTAGH